MKKLMTAAPVASLAFPALAKAPKAGHGYPINPCLSLR